MKGQVFSLEAILAISLLVIFAIVVSFIGTTSFVQHQTYERFHYLAQDSLELLIKTKVSYVVDKFPAIKDLKDQGILRDEDMDKSLLDVIGSLWANGTDEAKKIAKNITESILNLTIPENLGYEVSMDGTSLANRSKPVKSLLSVSKTTVSGYAVGKPVEGYTARAYLEKILGKNTASYFYFGGFVGQGNITAIIRDIPLDANISSIYIEGTFGSNFTLYVNKTFCGIFNKTSSGYFAVDSFIINESNGQHCLNQINKGYGNETAFDINFTSPDINEQFIGGGYIKVTYDTTEFTSPRKNVYRYYFPGIYGLINLYDSFYLPGTLDETNGMRIHLHYYSNLTTPDGIGIEMFLNIGGIELNRTNATGEVTIDLSFENISEKFGGIDALKGNVSNRTVPIRFGSEEFQAYGGVGLADAVLITDISGSMSTCDVDTIECPYGDCNGRRSGCQNTRLQIAKLVDNVFVDTVLNTSGNRVGLVAYTSYESPSKWAIRYWYDLSNDSVSLKNQINSYTPEDWTCISCGINVSTEILLGNSTPSRFRGMLVMSDGQANRCIGTNAWRGSLCNYGVDARNEAVSEACKAREKNLTVFAVAFGSGADTTTLRKIACWNCSSNSWITTVTLPNGSTANCLAVRYGESNNYEELRNIYKQFAEYFAGTYVTQRINVTGEVFKGNYLYPDSYIEFYYEPEAKEEYGEISLKVETNPFGCNGTFFVPQQVKVLDVIRTSYSSDFWSRRVYVNNSAHNWNITWSLDSFGSNYVYLGDPFSIQFSPNYIKSGENNTVGLVLGLGPTNISSICSSRDRVIYTGSFKSYTAYSPIVFPYIEGRNITVYYDRDHDGTADGSYPVRIGRNLPKRNETLGRVQDLNVTHNAVDYAFLMLLNQLNFIRPPGLPENPLDISDRNWWPGTENNPIDIMITPEILFETLYVATVPSLWGPTNLEIKVWT
ncbi:MAG: vWA domain-containing protein [Candidatus Aenigmatarchaeota archaeon]